MMIKDERMGKVEGIILAIAEALRAATDDGRHRRRSSLIAWHINTD